MTDEKLNAGQEEARFFNRLIVAWSSAQTVVEQLTPVLLSFGLIKESGGLNTDRVLAIQKKARGEELEKP